MAKSKRERSDDRGSFSGQLRGILSSRDESIYSLELDADIPRGGLARFMAGERGLATDTLDRLARSLGLRLVEVEKRKGNRRPKKPRRPDTSPATPAHATDVGPVPDPRDR